MGLRPLLDWETPRVSSALAALSNALAGVLFSAMVLVQMAVGSAIGEKKRSLEIKAVWLGLDVAWDVYIGLGALCFGLARLGHPRFGRVFGCCGMAMWCSLSWARHHGAACTG